MDKNYKNDISDNEIRILGTEPSDLSDSRKKSNRPALIAGGVILILVVVLLIVWLFGRGQWAMEPDGASASGTVVASDSLSIGTVSAMSTGNVAYVTSKDTTVNDIPLKLLIPSGGKIELYIGKQPERDRNVILAAHAADIRADIDAPTGAFVYNGQIMAKGHSKLGFCSIIKGEVSIGRQRETPLFERAVEENGSFFRQYSLVSNGMMVDIPPKGKAKRRALCLKDNRLFVVSSQTQESYHDFAQALADIGILEAISLTGSTDASLWRDKNGNLFYDGEDRTTEYKTENYILWRR